MHAEHTADEHVQKHPGTLGRLIMVLCVGGGLWLVTTMLHNKTIPLPPWAVMAIMAVTGILIGGSSTLVPEERGGRAATYVGFVIVAIAILLMFDVWIFHAAGT